MGYRRDQAARPTNDLDSEFQPGAVDETSRQAALYIFMEAEERLDSQSRPCASGMLLLLQRGGGRLAVRSQSWSASE